MLVCVMAILFAVPACNKNNNNPDSTTPPSGETTDPDNNGKLILILSDTNLVLASGETKKLTVRSSLTGMETSGVLWVTDNPDVATVDTSGKVTGIADGEATITVSTLDGLTTAECKVTVASKVTQLIIRKKEIYLDLVLYCPRGCNSFRKRSYHRCCKRYYEHHDQTRRRSARLLCCSRDHSRY